MELGLFFRPCQSRVCSAELDEARTRYCNAKTFGALIRTISTSERRDIIGKFSTSTIRFPSMHRSHNSSCIYRDMRSHAGQSNNDVPSKIDYLSATFDLIFRISHLPRARNDHNRDQSHKQHRKNQSWFAPASPKVVLSRVVVPWKPDQKHSDRQAW